MGDISQGRDVPGYQNPESRRLAAVESRLGALEAEVDRLLAHLEGRTQAQQEAHRRMMGALSGASVVGGDT